MRDRRVGSTLRHFQMCGGPVGQGVLQKELGLTHLAETHRKAMNERLQVITPPPIPGIRVEED